MAITLKTDRKGLAIVDRARVRQDWTALSAAWCDRAKVSLSTLKRFREKKAIQKDAFIAICHAVGIYNWQSVVADSLKDVSILQRRCRQSKRVIAEEVLSNLSSLEARLAFVAQAFEDDPTEAKSQIEAQQQLAHQNQRCRSVPESESNLLPVAERQGDELLSDSVRETVDRGGLLLEANVSIIQIMMAVEP